MARRATRGRRAPLSRERVLRAAVALADADGIESLTMRGLASRLQVEAMSLYNHVDTKDDILDGMLEVVAGEFEEPDTAADWKAAVRQRAISAHDVLVRHPWSSIQWATRIDVGPARMRYMDAMLRELREAGFAPGRIEVAFHTVQNHIVGHALQESTFPFDAAELPAMSARYLEAFPVDDFPDLAAHIRYHMETPDGGVSSFEFGLDAILDALERTRGPA